jgi:serine phosphatase RsbU (regulator of sigma subunit)
LGYDKDVTWAQRTIYLASGDLLVLYTDGVTDAENGQGVFFGKERLLETALAHRECSTQEMQDALMEEIHEFVGDAPQFDDITLMIVKGGD